MGRGAIVKGHKTTSPTKGEICRTASQAARRLPPMF
jgi:hypothetical protein